MRMHGSSGSPDVGVKTGETYAKHRGLPAPGGFCMTLSIAQRSLDVSACFHAQ